jgi:hypothetical protein
MTDVCEVKVDVILQEKGFELVGNSLHLPINAFFTFIIIAPSKNESTPLLLDPEYFLSLSQIK